MEIVGKRVEERLVSRAHVEVTNLVVYSILCPLAHTPSQMYSGDRCLFWLYMFI